MDRTTRTDSVLDSVDGTCLTVALTTVLAVFVAVAVLGVSPVVLLLGLAAVGAVALIAALRAVDGDSADTPRARREVLA